MSLDPDDPNPAFQQLDPDDPNPAFQQVTNRLRAAILTKKLPPGHKLPSGLHLAKHYGVARMTIDRSLRSLRDEGLIVTRKGVGSFVRERTERPVGLRPHLEKAFDEPHVTVDFAGFSSETLHTAMEEPLDKIRSGRLTPESINVRLLLPDTTTSMTVPVLVDGLEDDPVLRERVRNIALTHSAGIAHSVEVLEERGLIQSAKVEVKVYRGTPLFKLYILNNTEVFFGFYPLRERSLTIGDEPRTFVDVIGKDATLFHRSVGPDEASTDSQYVEQAKKWFDSVWNTIAHGRES